MEDASTSETGSSPLLRYVCTRAQIYGMSHTFVMGSKFKICRTTALRKMLPRSPRLSLRLSEILWLNELAEHSSGHNFETAHLPSPLQSGQIIDGIRERVHPVDGKQVQPLYEISRSPASILLTSSARQRHIFAYRPFEGSSLIRSAFFPSFHGLVRDLCAFIKVRSRAEA